ARLEAARLRGVVEEQAHPAARTRRLGTVAGDGRGAGGRTLQIGGRGGAGFFDGALIVGGVAIPDRRRADAERESGEGHALLAGVRARAGEARVAWRVASLCATAYRDADETSLAVVRRARLAKRRGAGGLALQTSR